MYYLYFDGCKNGCASIIVQNNIEIKSIMIYGDMDSDESLLTSLCAGLEYCILKSITEIVLCVENYVLLKKLTGEDEMRNTLGIKSKRLLDSIKVQYKSIFRHENKAKQLAKEASQGI